MKFLAEFPKKGWVFPSIIVLFILAVSVVRAATLPEGDIFWGARNGLDILNNGIQVHFQDEWNVTTLGEPWSPNSWLWNVLLAISFTFLGSAGFFWLTFITTALTFLVIWGVSRKLRLPVLYQYGYLFLAWVVLSMWMNGRSNTVDILIIFVFLLVAFLMKEKLLNRIASVLAFMLFSFLLSVIWVNLHLTAVVGVFLFPVLVYLVWRTEGEWFRLLPAGLVGVATGLGLGVSPFGFEGLIKVSQVGEASENFFYEWGNLFAEGSVNVPVLAGLLFGLVALIYALIRKEFLYAVALGVLCYLTYDTIRFVPFLFIVATGVLGLVRNWKPVPGFYEWLPVVITSLFTVLAVLKAVTVAVNPYSLFPVNPESFKLIPHGSVVAGPLNASSALILYRPDVLVTIDGRNDLIGEERFIEATNLLLGSDTDRLQTWLEENEVDVVFVPFSAGEEQAASSMIRTMEELGWEQAGVTQDAVVYQPEK